MWSLLNAVDKLFKMSALDQIDRDIVSYKFNSMSYKLEAFNLSDPQFSQM